MGFPHSTRIVNACVPLGRKRVVGDTSENTTEDHAAMPVTPTSTIAYTNILPQAVIADRAISSDWLEFDREACAVRPRPASCQHGLHNSRLSPTLANSCEQAFVSLPSMTRESQRGHGLEEENPKCCQRLEKAAEGIEANERMESVPEKLAQRGESGSGRREKHVCQEELWTRRHSAVKGKVAIVVPSDVRIYSSDCLRSGENQDSLMTVTVCLSCASCNQTLRSKLSSLSSPCPGPPGYSRAVCRPNSGPLPKLTSLPPPSLCTGDVLLSPLTRERTSKADADRMGDGSQQPMRKPGAKFFSGPLPRPAPTPPLCRSLSASRALQLNRTEVPQLRHGGGTISSERRQQPIGGENSARQPMQLPQDFPYHSVRSPPFEAAADGQRAPGAKAFKSFSGPLLGFHGSAGPHSHVQQALPLPAGSPAAAFRGNRRKFEPTNHEWQAVLPTTQDRHCPSQGYPDDTHIRKAYKLPPPPLQATGQLPATAMWQVPSDSLRSVSDQERILCAPAPATGKAGQLPFPSKVSHQSPAPASYLPQTSSISHRCVTLC